LNQAWSAEFAGTGSEGVTKKVRRKKGREFQTDREKNWRERLIVADIRSFLVTGRPEKKWIGLEIKYVTR